MARRSSRIVAVATVAVVLLLAIAVGCGGHVPLQAAKRSSEKTRPADPTLVVTDLGPVRGVRASEKTIAFKGIPYAAPPVGPLRWKPPAPRAPWTEVRDASAFGSKCVQQSLETGAVEGGSEDCLTLNVWSPSSSSSSFSSSPTPTEGWPVMVFIHGGFFTRGSSAERREDKDLYDGRELVEHGPVVFVSLNYRVGALGYMGHTALAKESAHGSTGNYGPLDQVAALQWIQRNIAAFGGDPRRVMIFGQSAGGYSVCHLLASPLAKGLFSRAIMHSGSCSVSARKKAEAQGDVIAKNVGCDQHGDGSDLLGCLRAKTAEEIVSAKAPDYTQLAFNWGPTLDGYFLPRPPRAIFGEGKHNHVSLIMGVTSLEFTTLWKSAFPSIPLPKNEADYIKDVETIFGKTGGGGHSAADLVAHYPLASYRSPAHAIMMMMSDVWFVCPNRSFARLISSHQAEPVRRFYFTHAFDSGAARVLGAGHGIDLHFVFRLYPFTWWSPSPREIELSDAMMGYWTQFAKTGNPNPSNNPNGSPHTLPIWEPYDAVGDSYFAFDTPLTPSSALGRDLRKAECDFLDSDSQP